MNKEMHKIEVRLAIGVIGKQMYFIVPLPPVGTGGAAAQAFLSLLQVTKQNASRQPKNPGLHKF